MQLSPQQDGQMSKYEKQQLFTVDGNIQALQTAPGIVNLLDDIQKGAYFSGMVAGFSGEAGVLANSASLVMYDGEEVEHVALVLNGQLAVGTFEWVGDLQVGDDVTLVVSEIDEGPLFVHGILRKKDQSLWTPFCVDHTRHGWMLHAIKLGALILGLTWMMFGSFFIFDSHFIEGAREWSIFVFGSTGLITFVTFMSVIGMIHLGDQAEDIFQALNVPKFDRFRIKPYSFRNIRYKEDVDRLKKGHIFRFSDALAAHKKRFNLP
jgi:hypothetical protein